VRTVVFIVASALLLGLDRFVARHGGDAFPRWIIPAVWVGLAIWARVNDYDDDDGRVGHAIRMALLPVAGVFALYLGMLGWSLRSGSTLAAIGVILLPVGAALLLWWVVELVRGRSSAR
jgi:hypothetical protein